MGRIDKECKDRQLLLSLVRMARARWYAACSNLLYTHKQGDFFELLREKVPVIPLVVVPDNEGKLCFVQPQLPKPVTLDGVELPNYSLFGIEKQADEPAQWRVYDNRFYLHDWSTVAYSHGGVFAYGHELSSEPIENQKPRSAIVSNLYTKFAQTYGADKVLVPAFLSEMMKEKKQALKNNYERWAKESAKNGAMPHDAPLPRGGRKSKKELESVKVYALQPSQRPGVCLFIRLVATLDMCVKDLDSDFALRRNNSEDFVAHVALLEKITVPWLFCLFSPDKLFDVYEQVTPVCMFE